MKVTVLTPTRDRPDFLKRCIQSVNRQTGVDWEHLVVDMGDPPSRLPRHERRRVLHKTSEGPAKDFQFALDNATGQVVTPLSDDDELTPGALRTALEALGDREWLVGRTEIRDLDGNFHDHRGGCAEHVDQTRAGRYMLGGAVYWRRTLTDRIGGFDSNYDGAADFDLYVRFLQAVDPVVIPDLLYLYTDHPGTDSNMNGARQLAAAHRVAANI